MVDRTTTRAHYNYAYGVSTDDNLTIKKGITKGYLIVDIVS